MLQVLVMHHLVIAEQSTVWHSKFVNVSYCVSEVLTAIYGHFRGCSLSRC